MVNLTYKDKKIAIAGYGVEGRSAYRYFERLGAEVTIFDEIENIEDVPEGAKVITGEDVFSKLNDFDFVCRSPSVRPDRIITNGIIISATKEFFKECRGKIIGVTGTKGKGTTSSLIDMMLKEAGLSSHLVGNIGTPALDVLEEVGPDDFVVYELSSFQLWDMDQSPNVAVVLMVEEDHQDVHESLEEYKDAKANITRHQTDQDVVFYHPTNEQSAEVASHSAAQKKKYLSNEAAHIDGNKIVIDEQVIVDIEEVGLIGAHNLENICAAVSAAWIFTQDVESIAKVIKDFRGLEHRLEYVREIRGVKIYNDSFSAVPSAAIAALKSFTEPKVIFLGGYDKHQSYDKLIDELLDSNIRFIVLMGDTGEKIEKQLKKDFFDANKYKYVNSLQEGVDLAFKRAEAGDVVLFSPGSASFDMFKNFKDRGEKFKEIIGGI